MGSNEICWNISICVYLRHLTVRLLLHNICYYNYYCRSFQGRHARLLMQVCISIAHACNVFQGYGGWANGSFQIYSPPGMSFVSDEKEQKSSHRHGLTFLHAVLARQQLAQIADGSLAVAESLSVCSTDFWVRTKTKWMSLSDDDKSKYNSMAICCYSDQVSFICELGERARSVHDQENDQLQVVVPTYKPLKNWPAMDSGASLPAATGTGDPGQEFPIPVSAYKEVLKTCGSCKGLGVEFSKKYGQKVTPSQSIEAAEPSVCSDPVRGACAQEFAAAGVPFGRYISSKKQLKQICKQVRKDASGPLKMFGWESDVLQPLLQVIGKINGEVKVVRYLVVGFPSWKPIFFGLLEYSRLDGSSLNLDDYPYELECMVAEHTESQLSARDRFPSSCGPPVAHHSNDFLKELCLDKHTEWFIGVVEFVVSGDTGPGEPGEPVGNIIATNRF